MPWIAARLHGGYVHGVSAAVLGRGGHQLTRDTASLEARINGNHLYGPVRGWYALSALATDPTGGPSTATKTSSSPLGQVDLTASACPASQTR